MKFNPAHARKLASISALGAGALVVGMGEAEATIVYGNLNASSGKVGFSSGYASRVYGTLGATNVFSFFKSGFADIGGTTGRVQRSVRFSGLNGVQFATAGGMLRLFAMGSSLGGAGLANGGLVASRSWSRMETRHPTFRGSTFVNSSPFTTTGGRGGGTPHTGHFQPRTTSTTNTFTGHHRNIAPFSNEFALFKFTTGSHSGDFGWLELSLDHNSNAYGSTDGKGPDVTLAKWAFDDSGAPLDAGQEAPEPGTLATTGLGALALGALGVRRWRAAKSRAAA